VIYVLWYKYKVLCGISDIFLSTNNLRLVKNFLHTRIRALFLKIYKIENHQIYVAFSVFLAVSHDLMILIKLLEQLEKFGIQTYNSSFLVANSTHICHFMPLTCRHCRNIVSKHWNKMHDAISWFFINIFTIHRGLMTREAFQSTKVLFTKANIVQFVQYILFSIKFFNRKLCCFRVKGPYLTIYIHIYHIMHIMT